MTAARVQGIVGENDEIDVRVAEEVRAVLAEVLRRPIEHVALGADLEKDLGVDSLALIELSVGLEERFGIVVPPSASPDDLAIRTVADVARFVARRRAGGGR